ncbi:hypothetical protein ACHAXT_013015 [Thalassiosira profunda]
MAASNGATIASSDSQPKVRRQSPPSKASPDLNKFFVALIFVWICHTWLISHSSVHPDPPPSALAASLAASSSSVSYTLAKEQSDGFFDDISDSHWRTLQKYHAAIFPNFYDDLTKYSHGPGDKGNYKALKFSSMWNGQNFQVEFICPLARRLPSDSMADGPKWVCNPHRLKRKKDCLIYSVGSNGKAEFEKAVYEEIGSHCEIHTFDLAYQNKRNGDFATALKPYSIFHHWGLGPESDGAKMKTLQQTMEELGHMGRTIDIFKIDCEWCEWFTWKDWLTVDMRQILVETHNAPMPNAREMFFNLHDNGFVIFSKEANYENGGGGVEFAFVKVSPNFFLNNTMYYKHPDLPGIG